MKSIKLTELHNIPNGKKVSGIKAFVALMVTKLNYH